MKKSIIFFSLLIIFFASQSIQAADSITNQSLLCTGNQATLDCVKKNISTLYHQDYDHYYNILNNAEKKAFECSDTAFTSSYLQIYTMQSVPSEVDDGVHEFIDSLALKSPQCFLDATLLLDDETKKVIIASVSSPLFDENKDIEKALTPFRNNPKYKTLLVPFFEARVKTK